MSYTINHQTTIVIEYCCKCGINFGLPETLKDDLVISGKSFYCPNGHSQYFTKKESLEKKLRLREDDLKREKAYSNNLYNEKEDFRRKAAAQKGQKTKILNRIKNGVCPHCNRYFKNLHDHMVSKHKKIEPKI